jgi:hypothetical protein
VIGEDPERKATRPSGGSPVERRASVPGRTHRTKLIFLEKYCSKKQYIAILCLHFSHAQKYVLMLCLISGKYVSAGGFRKVPPVLRQVSFAAGKKPVLKSSSKGKSISWLDDVRLRC